MNQYTQKLLATATKVEQIAAKYNLSAEDAHEVSIAAGSLVAMAMADVDQVLAKVEAYADAEGNAQAAACSFFEGKTSIEAYSAVDKACEKAKEAARAAIFGLGGIQIGAAASKAVQ